MIIPVIVVAGAVYGGYRLGKYVTSHKDERDGFFDRVGAAYKAAADAIEESWTKTAKSPQPKPEVQPDTDLCQKEEDGV